MYPTLQSPLDAENPVAGTLLAKAAVNGGSYSRALQGHRALRSLPFLSATLAAAALMVAPAKAASLLYHWDFSSVTDSVSQADLTLFGTASLKDNQLELPGGNPRTNYASLPIGSVWTDTLNNSSVSLEGWFTMDSLQNWSKVWMFGTPGAEPGLAYIDWTPRSGVGSNPPSSSINTGVSPGEFNTRGGTDPAALVAVKQYHTVVVYDSNADKISLYLDGTLTDSGSMGGLQLADLGTQTQNFLGAAVQFGDPDLDGRINDFRLYSGALNLAQVSALETLGVNATDAQIISIATPALKTWGGEVDGKWDTTTGNFTGDAYSAGNEVRFGDRNGNETPVTRRVVTTQAGGVTPVSFTVDNSNGGYTFLGAITKTTLTKTGTDSVTLGGAGDATDNTTLSAVVEAGTLILAKDSSATVHAVANLSIASGASVRLEGTGGNQIDDNGTVTIEGIFDLNGKSEAIASLTDAGVNSGAIINNGPAGSVSTLTVGTAAGTTTFSGNIMDGTGSIALVKNGASIQVLSAANTYTGGTTVNAGVLRAGIDTAFGTGTVTVNTGGTVEGNGIYTFANPVLLSGGTLSGLGGLNSYNGSVTVTAPSTINAGAGGTVALAGSLNGTAGLIKTGAGTLSLNSSNTATFSGALTINGGIVRADVEGALGSGTVTVNSGILALNGINQSISSLAGKGTVNLDAATLTVGANNSSSTFSGAINGTGGLTKAGTGTLTLGGSHTYTGATTISGGTLRLDASAPAAKANWSASTLTGAAGSAVTRWNDQVSGVAANAINPTSPTLGLGTLGGKNVVQFNGTHSLEVAGPNSPIANLTDYTVALVFRAATPGVGGTAQWYQNSGLVDAEQGGATNDWGIAFNSTGEVGGGNGNPDQTVYSGGGLADGKGHVVIFSVSGTELTLNVDGVSATPVSRTGLEARNVSRILFGSMNGINNFSGDIGQIAMYDTGVTGQRLNQIGAALASTYGLTASTSFDTSFSDVIADTSAISLTAAGATLDLNGLKETVGSLAGVASSSVTLGSGTLTSGGDNTDTTFLGTISGTGGLAKIGTGKLKVGGAGTYTGSTRVDGGSLIINGSLNGTTGVTVNSGGTLAGTGTITTGGNGNVTVASGGILAPGETTGRLTLALGTGILDISGAASLTNSQSLQFTLGTESTGLLATSGSLNIGTGVLGFDDFVFAGSEIPGGSYTLFDTANAITGTLADNLTGTLNGFSATLALSADGQDLVLNVVPEPTGAALLLSGMGALLGLRRFRRSARR